MSECTCPRIDGYRIKRASCPMHPASTPTPAPLTDEQIERYAGIYRQIAVDAVGFPKVDADVRETFDRWYAAVIAKAKREERAGMPLPGAAPTRFLVRKDVRVRWHRRRDRAARWRRFGNELNRIVREVSHGR